MYDCNIFTLNSSSYDVDPMLYIFSSYFRIREDFFFRNGMKERKKMNRDGKGNKAEERKLIFHWFLHL